MDLLNIVLSIIKDIFLDSLISPQNTFLKQIHPHVHRHTYTPSIAAQQGGAMLGLSPVLTSLRSNLRKAISIT